MANDFRFLTDKIPQPQTLAEAMWTSQWRGFASLIQPEYITMVFCKTSNGTATVTRKCGSDPAGLPSGDSG